MFRSLHFSVFDHFNNIWPGIKCPVLLITKLSPALYQLFSCNSISPQRPLLTQPQNLFTSNWGFQPICTEIKVRNIAKELGIRYRTRAIDFFLLQSVVTCYGVHPA